MRQGAVTVTTTPQVSRLFVAVLIGVGTFMQTVLIRLATGSYPPLWACLIIGGITGAACAVGRKAALHQAQR